MAKYKGHKLPMGKLWGHTSQEACFAAKQFIKDNPDFKKATVKLPGGTYYLVRKLNGHREGRIF